MKKFLIGFICVLLCASVYGIGFGAGGQAIRMAQTSVTTQNILNNRHSSRNSSQTPQKKKLMFPDGTIEKHLEVTKNKSETHPGSLYRIYSYEGVAFRTSDSYYEFLFLTEGFFNKTFYLVWCIQFTPSEDLSGVFLHVTSYPKNQAPIFEKEDFPIRFEDLREYLK